MALTAEHRRSARRIDDYTTTVLAQGGGDEALLVTMIDYMPSFKEILDAAAPGEVDQLCEQYDGFYHFAKLLESLAQGIADGVIEVPPEEEPEPVEEPEEALPYEAPLSPGHSLLTMNENMHTDILKMVHMTIYDLKDQDDRSPILYLIEAIEATLAHYEGRELYDRVGINPFHADPMHRYQFDVKVGYQHDIKLLKFQLKELSKTRDELKRDGFWERG